MKAFLSQTWHRLWDSPQPLVDRPEDAVRPETSPSGSSVRIRPMTLEDLPQVHAIDNVSFSMPWPLSSYRFELLENPSSLLWVAETDLPGGNTLVVGMVVVWLFAEEAHIATIAVDPAYRRRGIGRQLLSFALHEAVRRGASQATLEVRVGNLVAQNLYRQFGFCVVGRRSKYYQDNQEDALIMTANGLNYETLKKLAHEAELNQRPTANDAARPIA